MMRKSIVHKGIDQQLAACPEDAQRNGNIPASFVVLLMLKAKTTSK
jgi:hypothetical protein